MPSGSSIILGNCEGPFNFKEGDGREPAGTFCSLGVVLISHPPMLALSFSNQVRCSFFFNYMKIWISKAPAYFGEMHKVFKRLLTSSSFEELIVSANTEMWESILALLGPTGK